MFCLSSHLHVPCLDEQNLCATPLEGSQSSPTGTPDTLPDNARNQGCSEMEQQKISSFLTSVSALPTSLLFLKVNTTLIFSFPWAEHVSFNSRKEMRRLSLSLSYHRPACLTYKVRRFKKGTFASLFLKGNGVISAYLIKAVDKNIYCNSFLSFHFFLWLHKIRMENF